MLAQGGLEMTEATANPRIHAAMQAAHEERAKVFGQILAWVFRSRNVPLNQPVLTEPCR
jgi:hypothetical protein